eukprot:5145676-Amphidinium_carterae.1
MELGACPHPLSASVAITAAASNVKRTGCRQPRWIQECKLRLCTGITTNVEEKLGKPRIYPILRSPQTIPHKIVFVSVVWSQFGKCLLRPWDGGGVGVDPLCPHTHYRLRLQLFRCVPRSQLDLKWTMP